MNRSMMIVILFLMIATTLMGSAIVAALTMGRDTAQPIMLAALGGFLVAMPATWLIARRLVG